MIVVATFLIGAVGYYLDIKPGFRGPSSAVTSAIMIFVWLGLLWDVLRHPDTPKGLAAAFALLVGFTSVLIYFAIDPQSLLDWLYGISGGRPNESDPTFVRLMIGFVVAWLIWQIVEVRKKIRRLKQLEQSSAHASERHFQHASDAKNDVASVSRAGISPNLLPANPSPTKGALPPGMGPRLLLLSSSMVFGALGVAAGLGLMVFAFLTDSPGSQTFWGWMGGAMGCLIGGAGSLAGTWNSYRQLEGAPDLLEAPHHTWFDRVIGGYTLVGIAAIATALLLSLWFPWYPACYGLALLGGIVAFQVVLFLVIRGLLRRAKLQEIAAQQHGGHRPAE